MKRILIISFLFWLTQSVQGQVVSFSRLNTSNGLSDNNIQCLAIDKNGFLWIGTTDGLNVYDGYDITLYNKSRQAGMLSDTIRQLYCDSRNRIWMIHPGRIGWVDEKKIFHAVILPGKQQYSCRITFETQSYGTVVFTSEGHFYYQEDKNKWEKIEWVSPLINRNDYNTLAPFTKDAVIYIFEQKVIIVDYKSKKIIFEKDITGAVTACSVNDKTIAVATRNGEVMIIDITTGQELQRYQVYNELNGRKSGTRVSEMVKASDGSLALATGLAGLVIIDSATNKVTYYQHDVFDPGSVSTNLLYRVLAGPGGEVIAGAINSGVSICNINNKRAEYKTIFRDIKGNVFDGHPNEIVEDKQGYLWLSTVDRLVRWDKNNNISAFYPYYFNDPSLGPRNLEIRTLWIDHKERIWVGAIGAGVAIFDRNTGNYRLVSDTSLGGALKDTYINDLMEDSNGEMWVCTYKGIYTINTSTLHITQFDQNPLLKEISNKVGIAFYEDKRKRVWIGTQRYGVYCYDKLNNRLDHYTTENGLLSNTDYAITGDQNGNVYVADINGFNIIDTNGRVRNFTRSQGMRYTRVESILVDNDGHAWLANNKCLIKYTLSGNKLEYFGENAGISMDGFRYTACCKTKDGRLFFGTNKGINYFAPRELKNFTAQLRVNIYQVSLPDSIIHFTDSQNIRAKYPKNNAQFYFAAINLTGSHNIAYRYQLEGFDKEWQNGDDLHSARYSSLPAGQYVFKVKASIDRINWVDADNEIMVEIIPPFWKRTWFILAIAVFIAAMVSIAFRLRINRVRYNERLKTIYNKKISETEMKALRAQMNPHFIFNSLNSINKYILKNDHTNASRYLTRFAKLIRLILDNSNNKEVALSNELEALRLYIDMEALRFTNKFSYEINVDESLSPDTLQVPPMIIQPYVENAIWHGLLHKETGGRLSITVKKTNDNMLQCIIEDNGIGRARANELKSKSATANKSLGMKLTEERISMLNKYASLNASIEIVDLINDNEATGTKVILTIPI